MNILPRVLRNVVVAATPVLFVMHRLVEELSDVRSQMMMIDDNCAMLPDLGCVLSSVWNFLIPLSLLLLGQWIRNRLPQFDKDRLRVELDRLA